MKDSDGTSTVLATLSLAAATRCVVERMAPRELDFLDDVLAAWERQDLTHQRGGRRAAAGTVGLGASPSCWSRWPTASIRPGAGT